jgi:hypothetical protein
MNGRWIKKDVAGSGYGLMAVLYRLLRRVAVEKLTHSLTHSLTHGAEPFLRSCQLCTHSRTSQRFMEPESSLPRSQEPSTGPYPQPDRSNPYHTVADSRQGVVLWLGGWAWGYQLLAVKISLLRNLTWRLRWKTHKKKTHASQCWAEIRTENLPTASLRELQLRQSAKL